MFKLIFVLFLLYSLRAFIYHPVEKGLQRVTRRFKRFPAPIAIHRFCNDIKFENFEMKKKKKKILTELKN